MAMCLNVQPVSQECKKFHFCCRFMHHFNISWHERYGVICRLLSSPTCPVLEALGKKLSFEIAVGLNGRVWVCRPLLPLCHMFFFFACYTIWCYAFFFAIIYIGWSYEYTFYSNFSFPFHIIVAFRWIQHLLLQLSLSLMQLWTQRHWAGFSRE